MGKESFEDIKQLFRESSKRLEEDHLRFREEMREAFAASRQEMQESLAASRAEFDKRAEKLQKNIDQVGKNIDEVGKRIDNVGKHIEEVGQHVNEVGKRIDDVGKHIEEVGKNVDAMSKRVDAVVKRVDEVVARVDKVVERVDKVFDMVGGMSQNIGYAAETYFQTALDKTLCFAGIQFDDMLPNLKKSRKGDMCEFDIVLVNHEAVALIEAKHRVHPSFLEELVNKKAHQFRAFFPAYKNYKLYLGVAGFSFDEQVIEEARKYGVCVLKQNGDAVEFADIPLKVY